MTRRPQRSTRPRRFRRIASRSSPTWTSMRAASSRTCSPPARYADRWVTSVGALTSMVLVLSCMLAERSQWHMRGLKVSRGKTPWFTSEERDSDSRNGGDVFFLELGYSEWYAAASYSVKGLYDEASWERAGVATSYYFSFLSSKPDGSFNKTCRFFLRERFASKARL